MTSIQAPHFGIAFAEHVDNVNDPKARRVHDRARDLTDDFTDGCMGSFRDPEGTTFVAYTGPQAGPAGIANEVRVFGMAAISNAELAGLITPKQANEHRDGLEAWLGEFYMDLVESDPHNSKRLDKRA